MDNDRFDQDGWSWDQEPFIEDGPPAPPEADDLEDEFPWFTNQNSVPPPRPPQRSAGYPGYGRPPGAGQSLSGGRPAGAGQPRSGRPAGAGQPRSGGQRPRNTSTRRRRRRKRRSVAKTILLILLVILLALAALGGLYYYRIMSKINFKPSEFAASQEENIKKVDRLTNILLVGEDSRRQNETGQRSDSMILCTLNPDTHEVILTSFMRDMYVPIPGYKNNRINTAFSKGGVDLLRQTIEEDFGVHIDGYVSIDFNGFIEAVASLGDMQMELTEEEAEYMNEHPEFGWADEGTVWHLEPGWNTLDSWQFLCYARMRHLGNSDFDRTERQRKVLMTCYQQVKNCSVPKLLALIDDVAPYITTDLRGSDLLSYAYMLAGEGVNNIESFRIPADGTYKMKNVNGMEVLVPDLEQNKAILQEFINNTRSNQEDAGETEETHMGVVESAAPVAEAG